MLMSRTAGGARRGGRDAPLALVHCGLGAICLLVLAATAWGKPGALTGGERFSGATLLYLTPTADVLPPAHLPSRPTLLNHSSIP
jgi:hypothetical protein